MIFVQTPTGTKVMSIDELLADDVNLNEIQAGDFVDPMSMRIPSGAGGINDLDTSLSELSDEEILAKIAEQIKENKLY